MKIETMTVCVLTLAALMMAVSALMRQRIRTAEAESEMHAAHAARVFVCN